MGTTVLTNYLIIEAIASIGGLSFLVRRLRRFRDEWNSSIASGRPLDKVWDFHWKDFLFYSGIAIAAGTAVITFTAGLYLFTLVADPSSGGIILLVGPLLFIASLIVGLACGIIGAYACRVWVKQSSPIGIALIVAVPAFAVLVLGALNKGPTIVAFIRGHL